MAMASSDNPFNNEEWFNEFVLEYYGENYNDQFLRNPTIPYNSSKTTPEHIKLFINLLASCYLIVDERKLILSWRGQPEWEESLHSPIVYYLVNLIVYKNTNFIPSDLKEWLTRFTRNYNTPKGKTINLRKLYLNSAYLHTKNNIIPLNNAIRENEVPVSQIAHNAVDKRFAIKQSEYCVENIAKFDEIDGGLPTFIKDLYKGDGNSVIIFSGISPTVFTNETVDNFIAGIPFEFPMRSWTMDLRVAVYFSPIRDKLDPSDTDKDYYNSKVLFMMRTDKLCYASPSNSWEAEVFKPAGNYFYETHFITYYNEYIPSKQKSIKTKLFVIVIKKIEETDLKPITEREFSSFINGLYFDSGLEEENTQDVDLDEDVTLPDYWKDIHDDFKRMYKDQMAQNYFNYDGGRGTDRGRGRGTGRKTRRGRKTKHIKRTRHSKNARHYKKTQRKRNKTRSHKRRK